MKRYDDSVIVFLMVSAAVVGIYVLAFLIWCLWNLGRLASWTFAFATSVSGRPATSGSGFSAAGSARSAITTTEGGKKMRRFCVFCQRYVLVWRGKCQVCGSSIREE